MNRQQTVLVVVTLLGFGVGTLMLAGFLQYLLAGAILAFVTRPAYHRFADRVPRSVAAGLVVGLTIVLAVLPFLVLVVAIADDLTALASSFSLQGLPTVAAVESLLEGYTGQHIDLASRLRAGLEVLAGWIAGSAPGVLGAAANVLVGLSLMLVVQFYLVRDWAGFASWSREFDMLPTTVQNRLYESTGRATWSVVKGHVFVAVLQGLAAGLGLWLVGIPRVFFLTFLMVILGFIPMVGSMLVWAPAGLYLVATGDVLAGVGLLVYGGLLIGVLDNLARPLLIDEAVDLHDLFVLLGVIGGVAAFGPVGIFVGPVVFAVLGELLDVYRETFDDLEPGFAG
ncbi:MAG: AI-2E family transporter [Halobacteriales archaeon]